MKELFKPKIHIESIFDIDIEMLKNNNIKGLIIDIDNTLVPWSAKNLDKKAHDFILKLIQEGFQICFLSNGTRKRVEEFNKDIQLPAIYNAGKPFKLSYKKAMKLMNTNKSNTAVIGDQIFTDIMGGNKLGLFTILVNPLSKQEFFWTRFVRILEKMALNR